MQNTVREEARDLPVLDDVDVLVAGAGLAGFSAALAAARAGAKTLLVERNGCLGGVATASMMGNIGNRYILADGTQAVKGIAGEIVQRLVSRGGASPNWQRHNGICMDGEILKVILIEMLTEAQVEVLTHCPACRPLVTDGTVRGAFIENKSGRQAILARNTVDCTGEADLAHRAGATCVEHRASSTLLFKLSGVDIDRFVAFLGEDPDGFPAGVDWVKDYATFARRWHEDGVLFFPHHGGKSWRWLQELLKTPGRFGELRTDKWGKRPWWGPAENIEAFGMYTHRRDGTLTINTGYYCFDRIDVRELSRFELHAQRFALYAAEFMIRNIPGFAQARVEHLGVDLGLRGGRYIKGRATLRIADFLKASGNSYKDDVIATAPVSTGEGDRPGDLNTTCDIPFGSCVPQNLHGLLVGSGKSVDAEGGNYRIYRGMSGCMVYGQASGAAAALAAQRGISADALPVRELQRELLRQGVRLGHEARLQELGLT